MSSIYRACCHYVLVLILILSLLSCQPDLLPATGHKPPGVQPQPHRSDKSNLLNQSQMKRLLAEMQAEEKKSPTYALKYKGIGNPFFEIYQHQRAWSAQNPEQAQKKPAVSNSVLKRGFQTQNYVLNSKWLCPDDYWDHACINQYHWATSTGDWDEVSACYNSGGQPVYEIIRTCEYDAGQSCYDRTDHAVFYTCCDQSNDYCTNYWDDDGNWIGPRPQSGDSVCSDTIKAAGTNRQSCFSCPSGQQITYQNGKAVSCSPVGQNSTETKMFDFGIQSTATRDQPYYQLINNQCVRRADD